MAILCCRAKASRSGRVAVSPPSFRVRRIRIRSAPIGSIGPVWSVAFGLIVVVISRSAGGGRCLGRCG